MSRLASLPVPARLLLSGIAVVAIALALAACGGGDDNNPPVTSTARTSNTPASSAPPAATSQAGNAGNSQAKAGSCTGPGIAAIPRDNVRKFPAYPDMVIDPAKTYTAVVNTSRGDITMSLAADKAPKTVNSFVFLSCHGFYDGLIFHRVVPNFVIQGGDPNGNGTGGPGYTFGLEISDLKHDTAGTLAMARAQDPNSNGSQWYITTAVNANTQNLDGQYTVFGKVTSGMDVVLAIRQGDKINSISIAEQ